MGGFSSGAFLWASVGIWVQAPWSAVLRLSQLGSHSLRCPPGLGLEQWSVGPCAWSSGLLGLVPDLMVGSAVWRWGQLQFRFGWGRSVCIVAIIYCFGGELALDYGLCMDFVLHHWGER